MSTSAMNTTGGSGAVAPSRDLRSTPTGVSIVGAVGGLGGVAGGMSGGGAGPVMDRSAPFHAIDPSKGERTETTYFAASPGEVDAACRVAWDAFHQLMDVPAVRRAEMLERAAANITAIGDALVRVASEETGLADARVAAERDRTANQLRLFARIVREGHWVDAVIDHGEASRRPMPKPDVRRMRRALGPVAVFGASNFPLAYSAGGGDTASALAAGCPVIVKGHPSHPGTGELVAHAIARAISDSGLPAGMYGFLHSGGTREIDVGRELILHPCVRAAGFTGSFDAGTALAALGASRPDPIPVFAEMGSVNPMFLLPGAVEKDPKGLAERIVGSMTNSAGQMCTCPGLVFVVGSLSADSLVRQIGEMLAVMEPMTMLSPKVRAGYLRRVGEMSASGGVEIRAGGARGAGEFVEGVAIKASATLLRTTLAAFRNAKSLHEECFGPAALAVVCENEREMIEAATLIHGSLTGSIWHGGAMSTDMPLARRIQMILEQRVGRLIFNGVPTGVEVCHAMVHGGPYPATNQPHTSAVGPLAMQRWTRPVCYQNCPDEMLPAELREGNPLRIARTVDGAAFAV